MMKVSTTSKHHPLHSRRRQLRVPFGTQRLLAALEGIEGGFAIGSSIVVALSFSGLDRRTLLTTAILSIIVSGFNSASVKYSSEHYLDELDGREKHHPLRDYFMPAFIEFVCYFALSFVAVIPLIVIADQVTAIILSCIVTLVVLFIAGFWRGFVLRTNRIRDAVEIMLLGSGIVLVGLVSGLVANSL